MGNYTDYGFSSRGVLPNDAVGRADNGLRLAYNMPGEENSGRGDRHENIGSNGLFDAI